jgi:hypothetical protein
MGFICRLNPPSIIFARLATRSVILLTTSGVMTSGRISLRDNRPIIVVDIDIAVSKITPNNACGETAIFAVVNRDVFITPPIVTGSILLALVVENLLTVPTP